jgi:hypothetical protein
MKCVTCRAVNPMMNLFVKHDTDSEVEDLAPLFDGDRRSVKKETSSFLVS